MTIREVIERDWDLPSCDYKARLRLFYVELSLSMSEAYLYSKMKWATLPENLKVAIESWYVRANEKGQPK